MKIGVFDSGLGGLFLLRSMLSSKKLRKYDFVFLGDTKHLPYGNKSQKQIYALTANAVKFLFEQGCLLVIVACNTASAQALRKIQRDYLPKYYANRKVLGVIRPTVELIRGGDVCILATNGTVKAQAYTKELKKLNPKLKVSEIAAPELVQLIENVQLAKLKLAVETYSDLIKSKNVKNLILGCTHYALIKDKFSRKIGKGIKVISQDEIVPKKLADYLSRHEEIASKLSKKQQRKFYVTRLDQNFSKTAKKWFGKKIALNLVKY
ncbi:MAG: glutamate racemase [Candidatus Doudnabacteria bacterium RIFCSPHIGHO2_01_FULL_45_18]|uniref:Glutamate racemase n=1 Tax=Candidatus Doudnabacteria bacterium RIFCSPHIGHO2_01_FULL_45_18 TaxID=1817823 RepID=A0A1F5NS63_9BACT|nr:MAG: glutamate racemase [Candidatus Doudnabacteria bacterium RIFCSPHIGHO2_01_FULL_45_18]